MGMLLVGLGNPGPRYARQRHNVGFMVADRLAERWRAATFKSKFDGAFTKASVAGDEVVLLKPMTFMNLSGESVQKAMRFFKVERSALMVVHDELDLAFGDLRIKVGGGTAGHNGLKSIVRHAGGNDFLRIRVGIGRPRGGPVEKYVLSEFDSSEKPELDAVIEQAVEMVERVLEKGAERAMNELHRG